jgi:hypothetical protein
MRPPRGSETVLQHGTPYSRRLPPRVGSTLLDGGFKYGPRLARAASSIMPTRHPAAAAAAQKSAATAIRSTMIHNASAEIAYSQKRSGT